MAKKRDFIAFRPGKHGQDIVEDLKKYANPSARIREAYRLAMAVERGEYVKVSDLPGLTATVPPAIREARPAAPAAGPSGRVEVVERVRPPARPPTPPVPSYTPPQAAPQKPPTNDELEDIRNNMLGGFD